MKMINDLAPAGFFIDFYMGLRVMRGKASRVNATAKQSSF